MVAALAVGLGAPADEVPGLEDFSSQEIVAQVTEALVKALSVPDGEPRLLVLEDLHWADNATLDLLATLPERMRGTPAFLLMVARTPLPGETRLSALLQAVGEWIDVKPLRQEESYRLVYALLGEHGLPERFLNRTVGRAEGNPMFIEELVKVLKDRGIIVRRDGAWEPADDLDDVQIPDTVESLLSTRIDALGTSTKRVLQYAAIVGRRFWSGVLRDVLVKQPVDSELGELMHSQIVRSLPESVVEGDREFLFQNLLLQEVAYEGLLRGLRSELHGAVARWLESELHDQNLESQELIAFHFERSPTPGAAGPYLRAAADRAQARGAQGDALTLVRRALAVAEPDERLSLLLMAEEIASSAGDRERWDEALADLEAELSESPDPGLLGEFAFRKGRRLLIQGKLTAARAAAQEALSALEAGEVTKRMADVHALFGRIQHQWGNYPSAREHYQTALAIHRETGDVPGELDLMDKLGLVEVDLDDFCRAVEIFDGVLERLREGSHHFREARVLAHRATALRWLGRYEEAEVNAREALDLAQRTGSRSLVASALMTLGFVLAAADAPRAQETLARAARAAEGVGRPALEARVWLSLADLDTGREAEGHAARAQELASRAGLVHIDILARSRLAELALEARRIDEADRLSGSAMRRLERHGSIQGPEEVVVWVRARVEAAMGNARRAAELWEEARSLLAETAARIPNPDDRRRFLEGVEPNPAILEGLPAPVGKGEME
jgi:tetratricopeptide (TPR) repeat protein